ncbi:TIGR02449 family protein [Gilvimarinus agarilyticus]|uniref:TIGR02449 family protein n=1 Tax=unclassified Gilvimarinus TaxID=2642066 RepID=UPI001C082EC5|nr:MULTISPECIES: TIGR02449 family protein [unclassified Gilvimarinus]MBU2885786.1 TIGR02449 family protein [Gilvimarinus agarilyticus]MDO6570640.1 TIGR02449 family protein [Gilvimarinus sp. 2_MG-2023]MDO6746695.1 TIGR02449 family protein [Gilvimarinus sp. 1_MG-2023]
MSDERINTLDAKLDELLRQSARLHKENIELKQRESDWQRERVRLIEKNDLARTRVEAMITRLKSLESE